MIKFLTFLLVVLSVFFIEAQDVITENGMVASAHELASKAGVDILRNGGNAIDAAIATAFTLSVVEPNASGLGGGGYLVLKMVNEDDPVFLDFREMAPGQSSDEIFYKNREDFSTITRLGGKSAGIPGMVAGLLDIHKKYGKLPIDVLLNQAIKYARNGFEISSNLRPT